VDLNKLQYFYTVARYEHVTHAAEALHITQPALTKTIKQLERELDVPLFRKQGRNISLTPYGAYLKSALDGVFGDLEKLPEELTRMKEQRRRTLRLNVLAASQIVTDAIVSYKKENEQILFQIIQSDQERECDISVTTNTVDFSRLPAFQRRCVMEEKIYLAVPKSSEYAASASVDLQSMREKGFVYLAGSWLFRAICDHYCLSVGFRPNIVFESDSPATVRNIIGAGAGVGFWPAFSWGKVSHNICLLQISNPVCQRELIIGLHTEPELLPAAADFYEYLLRFMQKQQRRTENRKPG